MWLGVGGEGGCGCRGRGWVRWVWLGVGGVGGCRGECMCEGGCGWV